MAFKKVMAFDKYSGEWRPGIIKQIGNVKNYNLGRSVHVVWQDTDMSDGSGQEHLTHERYVLSHEDFTNMQEWVAQVKEKWMMPFSDWPNFMSNWAASASTTSYTSGKTIR